MKHYIVAKTVKTKCMHFYEGKRGVTREKERFDYKASPSIASLNRPYDENIV